MLTAAAAAAEAVTTTTTPTAVVIPEKIERNSWMHIISASSIQVRKKMRKKQIEHEQNFIARILEMTVWSQHFCTPCTFQTRSIQKNEKDVVPTVHTDTHITHSLCIPYTICLFWMLLNWNDMETWPENYDGEITGAVAAAAADISSWHITNWAAEVCRVHIFLLKHISLTFCQWLLLTRNQISLVLLAQNAICHKFISITAAAAAIATKGKARKQP